jgi:hypothetical protein
MKADLQTLADFAEGARIRASIFPATVERIEKASTASWLPIELDVQINEAVLAILGEGGVRDWNRRSIARAFEGPLLRPVIDASVKVFGLKPSTWLAWIPRIWPAVVRGCGEIEVGARSPTACTLVYTGVPPVVARSHAFMLGLCGACEGTIQLCHITGHAQYRRLAEDRFEFNASWK